MSEINSLKKIISMLEKQDEKISNIEKLLKTTQKNEIKKPNSSIQPKTNEKYTGLTKSIFDLIDDSFFDSPKELNAILQKLRANGVFHPMTNFSRPLLKLVRDKKLRRLKENKKWTYVKNG